jgi:diguanylate cyclase (GGDEF)-like protein
VAEAVAVGAVGYLVRRRRQPTVSEPAEAVLRVVGAIDDYLYTNEHCADGSRRSVFSGPNREKLMGGPVPPGLDVAAEWARLIHPDDWDSHVAHRERLQAGGPSEVRYRIRGYDGVDRWVHARARPYRDGDRVFVDGIVSDVTAQVAAEHALAEAQQALLQLAGANEHQALHDPLTGLGNRRKLTAELDAACGRATPGEPALLILFDLDGFKSYNDTFGHPAGDALLVRLAERLAQASATANAYRLGGDEFCVLAATNRADLEALIARTSTALVEEGDGFRIRSSFGAVFLPDEAEDAANALHIADQRLYNEKRSRQAGRARTADVLMQVIRETEPDLEDHGVDVAGLSVSVGDRLGLDPESLERLDQAALFHDVGKIGIPDSILHKPGPLDAAEWAFVQRHTIIGERILSASPALRSVARIVRSTHERVDGTGYPDGLRDGEIPPEALIIAVCNAFHAMTTDRPYRARRTRAEALAELSAHAGTQFDPAAVTALAGVLEESRQSVD